MEEKANKRIIGIRRENKTKWERRVALTPSACEVIIKKGYKILVQPSSLRCFTDKQYLDAGCEISEDIENVDVIVGVKEVPLDKFYPNKTYMFFSHTIKGQPANMPTLREILKKNIRLIDYECIKEANVPNPQRLVAFGRFAGLAGGFDFLQGLGEFLLHKNISTPFLHTGYSYMFPSVDDAKESLMKVGKLITKKHLPKELCPFIIGFTSNGRVSCGAQEAVRMLPHEYIDPKDLPALFEKPPRTDIVYLTVIESKDMYLHKETNTFNKEDFYKHPENYYSVFADKFIPYLSILYHCMFWDVTQPRIITYEDGHRLSLQNKFRMLGVSDITCDKDGSIEYLQKFTTIEKPFFTVDPNTQLIEDSFSKMSDKSILYHALDYLTAEFAIEASKHFSEKLSPFIESIVNSNYPSECDEKNFDLPPEILQSVEAWGGKLMPKYEYLYSELAKFYPEYQEAAKKN
jgi:alpha-aminoadipic semialdehyde synthase